MANANKALSNSSVLDSAISESRLVATARYLNFYVSFYESFFDGPFAFRPFSLDFSVPIFTFCVLHYSINSQVLDAPTAAAKDGESSLGSIRTNFLSYKTLHGATTGCHTNLAIPEGK